MNRRGWSHYDWLDVHFYNFLESLATEPNQYKFTCGGLIPAHGDKCYSYKHEWDAVGIPFSHGVAMYLLTYMHPWSREVRDTPTGFKSPHKWVINNYEKFKPFLTLEDLEKVV